MTFFNLLQIVSKSVSNGFYAIMLKENRDLLNAMVNDIYNEETDTLEYEWFGLTFDDLEEEYPLNRTASKLYQKLMTLYINNPASFAQIRDSFMQASKTA